MSTTDTKKGFTKFIDNSKFTTPKGAILWAKVHRPDTSFKKTGEYSIELRFDRKSPGEFKTLVKEKLAPIYEAWVKEVKTKLGKSRIKTTPLPGSVQAEDPDTGEPTGQNRMVFRKPAYIGGDNPAPPIRCFDSKGHVFKSLIGNGSEGKVAFCVKGFYSASIGAGISLVPLGVQVLKHVAFEGAGEPEFDKMFDEEEGFEVSEDASNDASTGDDWGDDEKESKEADEETKDATEF